MTTRNLEQLAFLCDRNPARKLLQRYWVLSGPEYRQLQQDRSQLHQQWKTLRLGSRESVLTKKTIEWGEAEVEYWRLALALVQEWLSNPCPKVLLQAKSRFQMADQAFRQYLRGRMNLEALLVDKMISQSQILF